VLGPTTKGRWSYAASKALDEFLALSYWKEKGLPVVIARLFNTVGPGRRAVWHGVAEFCGQALEGAPMTVYGTGQQSRCFCDVRDSVEAILRLVATDKSVGEVVNVGSDYEVTIEDLAHRVKEQAAALRHRVVPYDQAYEPASRTCSGACPVSINWKVDGLPSKTTLPEIIDRVIAYNGRKKDLVAAPREAASARV